jgi:putative membrane protein
MSTLLVFLISVVAFGHLYFMILEMFFWTKPKGLKAFGLDKEFAEQTKVLASNQGLYNGFLAAGLIWSIVDKNYGRQIALFFLICVILAGIYGAFSTKKIKIFYIQAVPALLALGFLLFS